MDPVLTSLKTIKHLGIRLEVTTLVIPGINDDPVELKKAVSFIVGELGSALCLGALPAGVTILILMAVGDICLHDERVDVFANRSPIGDHQGRGREGPHACVGTGVGVWR